MDRKSMIMDRIARGWYPYCYYQVMGWGHSSFENKCKGKYTLYQGLQCISKVCANCPLFRPNEEWTPEELETEPKAKL